MCEHEKSKDHLEAVVIMTRRAKDRERVDLELEKQTQQYTKYWVSVLQRIVSVITFLCERGLAIRGEIETLGSSSNGNYLGILELLVIYDDFLKKHIQEHANRGNGHINYLSSTICEEIDI